MRNEILQLKDLGRMPNESINDTESIDELVNTYDALFCLLYTSPSPRD